MRISDWSSDVCSSDLDVEVPGDVRAARPHGGRKRHGPHRLPEPRGEGARDQSLRPWPLAHRHVEDRGTEAGARPPRLRRRLRRRAARRGKEPRQGAHLLLSYRDPRLGPEEAAPRALEPLQRAESERRKHPRLPDLELDRTRHLAIYRAREYPDRAALLRRAAAHGRARRPVADGRRRPLSLAAG